uniref:Uncharacterized protein n=1 Tax=Tetradesmus obliquus TaxID=3088 RepID=A0A383V8X1_TETOB|eukprot:jgi/Sobl393_1/5827/SZX61621.1
MVLVAQGMPNNSQLTASASQITGCRLLPEENCAKEFGACTQVEEWVAGRSSSSTPLSYRQLYPLLTTYSSFVGVWHQAGEADSPAGALFSFRWAPSGIEVVRLQPRRQYTTDIAHERLCMLGPGHARFEGDLVVGGTKCVLRDYGSSREQHCSGGSPPGGGSCLRVSAAEAAACVAAPLGSSPGASSGFGYELLRFMQGTVQKSGRRSRRSGGSSANRAPLLHHFSRVPCPSRQQRSQHPHRLAGLWKGLYGPHGCELLSLSLDFSQRSARIVATKLTGDVNVPAGEVTWRAQAAPLQQPWPAEEQAWLQLRPQMVAAAAATAYRLAESEAADEAAGDVMAALVQQEQPPQHALQLLGQHQQQQQQQGPHPGLQQDLQGLADGFSALQLQQRRELAGIAAWEAAMLARRVVSIYRGQGRLAGHGFSNAHWVEGRLWVYADGSCGFVFVAQPMQCCLVDLQRLDGDL